MPQLATTLPGRPATPFGSIRQQASARRLGMWVFLASETLLFGAFILAYTVYRGLYPEAWAAGAQHDNLAIGTSLTAVLLLSSLTVALAVAASKARAWGAVSGLLAATVVLGVLFIGLKFYEYWLHWQDGFVPVFHFTRDAPHLELFFVFYFLMTLLHALHMSIGIGFWTLLGVQAHRRRLRDEAAVETVGLYWHFVDLVWLFLYPLLYLVK